MMCSLWTVVLRVPCGHWVGVWQLWWVSWGSLWKVPMAGCLASSPPLLPEHECLDMMCVSILFFGSCLCLLLGRRSFLPNPSQKFQSLPRLSAAPREC